ncbi:ROK family protein [Fuchsiella alkaliacetigena]|uniref:ROK family protein n=1 Tax=Fuchsiella alkaliacetigena TaxID=957042 RepID=UPI00200A1247|nr:ROK family protein [Fuchsiella alkaliacetigena]MCK8824062.1 ROK family protein [Fuchsiella alkaliacetigena]
MGDYVVGVDLGGTKILTAVADLEGNILANSRLATKAEEGQQAVIARIIESIEDVLAQTELNKKVIAGVGVGCPGPLNAEEGIVYHAPNLDWQQVPIKDILADKLALPVWIENDANAAALGEKWFGAGQEVDNLIYITVSTGIGGGIIINRQLYSGANYSAGEIGHMTINPQAAIQCNCGNLGCWETLASGTALARLGQEAVRAGRDTLIAQSTAEIEDIDGQVVTEAAAAGDQVAQELVKEVTNYLGIGIANLINILNPELIILGGGVIEAGDMIVEPIKETVSWRALEDSAAAVEILVSELKEEIGVVGAVAKALVELDILK